VGKDSCLAAGRKGGDGREGDEKHNGNLEAKMTRKAHAKHTQRE